MERTRPVPLLTWTHAGQEEGQGRRQGQEGREGQGQEMIEMKTKEINVEFDEFMFGSLLPALESLAKFREKRDSKGGSEWIG